MLRTSTWLALSGLLGVFALRAAGTWLAASWRTRELALATLTGQGFAKGRQKFGFLPEPHTDFMFSMIGEEWGFVGVTLIVVAIVAAAGTIAVKKSIERGF